MHMHAHLSKTCKWLKTDYTGQRLYFGKQVLLSFDWVETRTLSQVIDLKS